MDGITSLAIQEASAAQIAYCKFITPNDVGETGGHQSGYHIHKNAFQIAFDEPRQKGSNDEKFIKIKWQNDFETESRFIYYGTGTRNEYRLTRFGRDFPFLSDDDIGSLLVLCKKSEDYYLGFVLSQEQQIDDFLANFDMTPSDANRIIGKAVASSPTAEALFQEYISSLDDSLQFPRTEEISNRAREISQRLLGHSSVNAVANPDNEIVSWLTTEYQLFQAIETYKYSSLVSQPSGSVDKLVETANMVLNRRKSRAGKSLEHHLSYIFDSNEIQYTSQGQTEGRHRPDFIMPSIEKYHLTSYPSNRLTFLGAKTTCKDRWRQVLSEAERIPQKHLFTLQPGISSHQLAEMKRADLTLVIPEQNINTFPPAHQEDLMTLKTFLNYVKNK